MPVELKALRGVVSLGPTQLAVFSVVQELHTIAAVVPHLGLPSGGSACTIGNADMAPVAEERHSGPDSQALRVLELALGLHT
jgi:hypothetical protein